MLLAAQRHVSDHSSSRPCSLHVPAPFTSFSASARTACDSDGHQLLKFRR